METLPDKKEPQVGWGLFGVRLLINSLLQISIFQIHQILNISACFSQFNLSFKKKYLFSKCPKITQTFTQNRKTLVNVLNERIWRCLKRKVYEILAQRPLWPLCQYERRQNSLANIPTLQGFYRSRTPLDHLAVEARENEVVSWLKLNCCSFAFFLNT